MYKNYIDLIKKKLTDSKLKQINPPNKKRVKRVV
jgi:hypothetical protein